MSGHPNESFIRNAHNPLAAGSADSQRLAQALTLDVGEAVALLREMPDLEMLLEGDESYAERFLSRVTSALHLAFDLHEPLALREVHKALFLLYELHVADPSQVRCVNQFNVLLTRARALIERRWLAAEIRQIPAFDAPADAVELIAALKKIWRDHPVAAHPIFDFLEQDASRAQIVAFFQSDSALNIRFFDLIVMSLVGSQNEVRRELAQNFWDEAGRGDTGRSHVNLFRHLLDTVGVGQADDDHASVLDWQGLAGYNLFMLGCLNRQHYFKSLGVMSMTELLDPSQYEKLARGCRRVGLGVGSEMDYYDEHITIDVVHGEGWLVNVIQPLAERTPAAMKEILLGASLRLSTCQDYYDDLYGKLVLLS